jgi:predicted nucleotidyltransferase
MSIFQERNDAAPGVANLEQFAQRAAGVLERDERVRAVWLTGSLAAGSADAQSDVDLRVAVRDADFARIAEWWPELVVLVGPVVWRRRWPGPPSEAIIGAIALDYTRFDLVVQSAADTQPRALEAARLLFDKDGLAAQIDLGVPAAHNPLAALEYVVDEFIRLLGMLTIVVERNDVPIGVEGQMGCYSLLLSLLLMEQGIDRMTMGKRHVARFLSAEQREALAGLPALAPTLASIVDGRVAYARLFLPRARRLMQANDMDYPQAFEDATWQHLKRTLGLDVTNLPG